MYEYCSNGRFFNSIKLNDEHQTIDNLKELSKLFDHSWEGDNDFDDILYSIIVGKWKPERDVNGVYGFVYLTQYEYDASDMDFSVSMDSIGIALYDYIKQTTIVPEESIKVFAYLYYDGCDLPFKF